MPIAENDECTTQNKNATSHSNDDRFSATVCGEGLVDPLVHVFEIDDEVSHGHCHRIEELNQS